MLGQVVRAEIMVALYSEQRPDQIAWQEAISGLQARRARLGESHGENDISVVKVVALNAGYVGTVVAKFSVSRIFHDENAPPAAETPGKLDNVLAPRRRKRQAAG